MYDRVESTARGLNRRRLLGIGGLATLGITLPKLIRADSQRLSESARKTPVAKSCILFFMEGGPSHIDMWDMKPDAPENVRGIYRPIPTSLPGFQVCEHLPRLARVAKQLTVVRSITHSLVDHNASSYYTLTGQHPMRGSQLIRGPSVENAPPFGSVLAKLRPSGLPVPDYVHLPKRFFNCGDFIPGVLAGFLGAGYDPFIAGDPSSPEYHVPGLGNQLNSTRFSRRHSLLHQLDSQDRWRHHTSMLRKDIFFEKAFSLITSEKARRAFDISAEPDRVRERYGLPQSVAGVRGGGMPHLGQCMLLARRLVEAGVRLVSVWAGGQAFDGHRDHYQTLTKGLCPPTDRAFSALIEDLADRGMLEETLVVALSEFGRTPKLGQITSSAGAASNGRDHWPQCYTALMVGGGMKAGYLFGRSDRLAAYPQEHPVGPADIAATIYAAMGIDPMTRVTDQFNRPHTLTHGTPIRALFA